ncbi:TonB-dependent receptor [Polaribacter pacificus]|uniref:TonB-dependent receptor n=1 Tax=Polaribacter pacificus TaxID=1775173 RepID=A0A917HRN4_9FLAO|nr:outer membrane beta-barrel family protein [Polaribacter pacificus]GGG88334.1 TonB-dependent receptor [Polaribacter pacificus]
MKKLHIMLICFFVAYQVQAQKITVKGTVVSAEDNETLMAAAITVFNAKTDAFIHYAYADEAGNYELRIEKTAFYIKADLLGYKTYISKPINPTTSVIEHAIRMQEDRTELEEVVILQKQRTLKMSGDKMTINIERAGLGIGNDGLQTLTKLPGIRLDKDENIVFRGNSNLQILIDGKPSLFSGGDLKLFLKTLSGDNIKSVELIANPSAKYSAAGSGGILNIKLKKGVNTGLTGNIRSSVGYAEFIKNSNGLNLYHNSEKWNLNLGLNSNYNESTNHRKVVQTINEPGKTTVLEQFNDWYPKSNSYTGTFGVSYALTKNSQLGSSFNYNSYLSDAITEGKTNEIENDQFLRYTLLETSEYQKNKRLTGNLYYSFVSDSLDTKLDAQINLANYNKQGNRITSNQYYLANSNNQYQPASVIRNSNPTQVQIVNTTVDLEKKINPNFNLETGLKYSYVHNDYDLRLEDKNNAGIFVPNTNRSNHLIYKESIFAGYGIANLSRNNWNFQLGLRAEHMAYDAFSKTANTTNKDSYTSWFPSFSINRNADDNQYKFSYSKRIERPRYLNLNPFFEYIDTYNVQVGNPNLQPAFTDAFELTWVRKYKTALSVFANLTQGEMYQIVSYDEATKITTLYVDNIGKSKSIGLSFNTSFSPTDWWELQVNTEVSYAQATSTIPGYAFNESGANFYGNLSQSFRFKNDLSFTWTSFYSKNGNYGNSEFLPAYDMSFGMRKEFLNKQLILNITAQDVLKENQWRQITTQNNVSTNWTNQWETRKFTLALTYNFGAGKKKKIKSANLANEQNRL